TITPNSGPLTGGTHVVISGTNLEQIQSITLGGKDLLDVRISPPTTIVGTTPPATTAGAVDLVIVSTTHGATTLTGAFTYLAGPVVRSITPSSGPTSGATLVTVLGAGFFSNGT